MQKSTFIVPYFGGKGVLLNGVELPHPFSVARNGHIVHKNYVIRLANCKNLISNYLICFFLYFLFPYIFFICLLFANMHRSNALDPIYNSSFNKIPKDFWLRLLIELIYILSACIVIISHFWCKLVRALCVLDLFILDGI